MRYLNFSQNSASPASPSMNKEYKQADAGCNARMRCVDGEAKASRQATLCIA